MIQSLENLTDRLRHEDRTDEKRPRFPRGLFSHGSGTGTEPKLELEFSLCVM